MLQFVCWICIIVLVVPVCTESTTEQILCRCGLVTQVVSKKQRSLPYLEDGLRVQMRKKMRYICEGLSLQNGRSSNMDRLLLKEKELDGEPLQLAVVCDGVGSMREGEYAAQESVQQLCMWLELLETPVGAGIQLCNAVKDINACIVEQVEEYRLRTASTLSALMLYKSSYYIAHVGDSRIYALWDDHIQQLTTDQTLDGKLTNYIGKASDFKVSYNEGERVPSSFLVCSDGLYKHVQRDQIEKWMKKVTHRNQKRLMQSMAQCAIDQGESDNISMISIICEG